MPSDSFFRRFAVWFGYALAFLGAMMGYGVMMGNFAGITPGGMVLRVLAIIALSVIVGSGMAAADTLEKRKK